MLFCMVFGVLFLGIGVLFFTGKALHWVAGWQAMPAEERERIRIMPLCRNLSAAFFVAGVIFVAGGLSPAFLAGGLRWAMIGWLILCGLDVWYIGKSDRYQIKPGSRK